jgi:uncharacterized Zn-binding protein involved in type VI secretion
MKISEKVKSLVLEEISVVIRTTIKVGGSALATHGYFAGHGEMITEGVTLILLGLAASVLDKWLE